MKKYNHPSDEFFRQALGDHRMAPSEEARKAFLGDAVKVTGSAGSRKKGYIAGLTLLTLLISGTVAWFLLRTGQSGTQPIESVSTAGKAPSSALKHVPNPAMDQVNKAPQSGPTLPPREKTMVSEAAPTTVTTGEKHVIRNILPVIKATDDRTNTSGTSSISGTTSSSATVEHPETLTDAEVDRDIANAVPVLDTVLADIKPVENAVIPEDQKKMEGTGDDKSNRDKAFSLSLGCYYAPEWMFNTLDGAKFINNFGLEGTFRFGRFSIRTGAGLSVGSGANELAVEYNDYLGAYNKLDSMQFKWNEVTQDYDPTMFLSKTNVYDSLLKTEYPRIVNRYTYLQIPMVMGYDFLQRERFTLGVRVGPVLSVLLSSKQLSAPYDPGNKQVVRINDISPGQVSLNWQALGGIEASFGISEKFWIALEPSAKYYFNSVYEKPAGNYKPWSVGIRAALIMKF